MHDDAGHVVIVGGGIAGLSLAFALAGRIGVTVLEAGTVGGQGASSLPAALLNPYRGRTGRAHPEDLAGLTAFWRRDDALRAAGHDTGAVRPGVLRIASDERQARQWRDMAAVGADVRRVDRNEIPDVYHAPHGGLLIGGGGWVQPRLLLAALAAVVRDTGGRVVEHARVERVTPRGAGCEIIASGRALEATHVVCCTGADPAPAGLESGLELDRVAGDVIELASSVPFGLPVAGAVYGAWTDGQVWVGGNHRAPERADPGAPEALRHSFGWFVPSVRQASLTSTWTGVRAKRPGNRPVAHRIGERAWFLGALAGRGFLCGADVAERLAAQLLASRSP